MTLQGLGASANQAWAFVCKNASKGWESAGHYTTQFLQSSTIKKVTGIGKTHIVDKVVNNWPKSLTYEWTTRNSFITGGVVTLLAASILGHWIGPRKEQEDK